MPKKMTLKEKAERRKRITDEFWEGKQAAVRTPQQRCQVAWDRIRAEMSLAPEHLRGECWTQLAEYLETVPGQLPKR